MPKPPRPAPVPVSVPAPKPNWASSIFLDVLGKSKTAIALSMFALVSSVVTFSWSRISGEARIFLTRMALEMPEKCSVEATWQEFPCPDLFRHHQRYVQAAIIQNNSDLANPRLGPLGNMLRENASSVFRNSIGLVNFQGPLQLEWVQGNARPTVTQPHLILVPLLPTSTGGPLRVVHDYTLIYNLNTSCADFRLRPRVSLFSALELDAPLLDGGVGERTTQALGRLLGATGSTVNHVDLTDTIRQALAGREREFNSRLALLRLEFIPVPAARSGRGSRPAEDEPILGRDFCAGESERDRRAEFSYALVTRRLLPFSSD